ncbi:amino acid/polyamine transporter I [Corynascus novoguineensis]|uniref:Amino acid/polyamine transporter I n=1 Tax=Corynascus novoguineensis TaxID=1126955 RepID=A0AAN7CW86_9PEZI|nr:amino acid/polyamine transporter I [Corynascus novoguineensis]
MEKEMDQSATTPPPEVDRGDITPSRSSSVNVAMNEADKRLEAMGYTPVFKREFSTWSSFSFAMSLCGVYASLMSTWVYGLQAGGAAAIMWSWILGGAGSLVLAMSLAELSSAYPSSGAMYTVLKYVAPEGQAPLLCWMSGYITLVGLVAGTASTEYASSQMLLTAVSIASNFSYSPTTLHVFGVMALLTIVHASINSLPTRWLNRLTSGYVIFHMSVLISACVCLLVKTKDKHSIAYAFTNFQPMSGWSPPGFAFLFGCLTPAWTMANADGAARISEEAKNPARVVPKAIASATTFSYAAGLLFNLVLVLCMGDDPSALLRSLSASSKQNSHSVKQPVALLFLRALGPVPAVFFTLAGFAVMNLVAIPGVQAGSRTIFTLARDDLVPLSRILRRVWSRSGAPVAAVWVYAGLVVTVNLLGLVSQTAISAVFNVCAVAFNVSYMLPLVCKMVYGRFERGPWHLGRWSFAANLAAVVWNGFVSVIFFLPTEVPVTGENMNYAIVVFVFVLLFSSSFWYTHGRHYYTGPGTQSKNNAQIAVTPVC